MINDLTRRLYPVPPSAQILRQHMPGAHPDMIYVWTEPPRDAGPVQGGWTEKDKCGNIPYLRLDLHHPADLKKLQKQIEKMEREYLATDPPFPAGDDDPQAE